MSLSYFLHLPNKMVWSWRAGVALQLLVNLEPVDIPGTELMFIERKEKKKKKELGREQGEGERKRR